MRPYVLCVHGGAGALHRKRLPAETDRALRAGLRAALIAGGEILEGGGSAVDAVEAAVSVLEERPDFNAGRGSVLNVAGEVEMDAAIMRGLDRAAGAVAAVRRTAYPIKTARRLLEEGGAVLLVAEAADDYTAAAGLETREPASFVTPKRRRQLENASRPTLDHDSPELGTVGAVALDGDGHLAAATSTGGLTGQARGRVGDSPIIGAGTWADDRSVAISATGAGEKILRSALAHRVDAELRLAQRSLEEACRHALDEVVAIGGRAGCIAIDAQGRAVLAFDTQGLARGVLRAGSEPVVALYGDEVTP